MLTTNINYCYSLDNAEGGQHVMQEYVMKHLILAGLKSGG